ncbi:hypothetical protein MTP99_004942 [Tenebrio molitor]|nr:hypothetical protein MTP99_004942 [Tenebrio molitor]
MESAWERDFAALPPRSLDRRKTTILRNIYQATNTITRKFKWSGAFKNSKRRGPRVDPRGTPTCFAKLAIMERFSTVGSSPSVLPTPPDFLVTAMFMGT